MKIIQSDITKIETGVIIQQVNCQNAMGAGVARAICEKWPVVKENYHKFCDLGSRMSPNFRDLGLLGEIQEITVQKDPEIIVINVFGQLSYGNAAKTGKRYTDYGALKTAFTEINRNLIRGGYSQKSGAALPFYIPKFFGAGLGGGDSEIIHRLIEYYLPDAILVDYVTEPIKKEIEEKITLLSKGEIYRDGGSQEFHTNSKKYPTVILDNGIGSKTRGKFLTTFGGEDISHLIANPSFDIFGR